MSSICWRCGRPPARGLMQAWLYHPQYIKRVPNTPFTVDGFRFPTPGCKSYFLTHAHADHTTVSAPAPSSQLQHGRSMCMLTCSDVKPSIYAGGSCSRVLLPCQLAEAKARRMHVRVQGLYPSFRAGTIYCSQITASFITGDLRIPAHCVQALPMDTPVTIEGVSVTLIDANHCPGAVLFLFRTKAPPSSEHPMQASVPQLAMLLPFPSLGACGLSGRRQ